jgi:hypothetical protein
MGRNFPAVPSDEGKHQRPGENRFIDILRFPIDLYAEELIQDDKHAIIQTPNEPQG